jgi:hypothetical protein
MAGFSGRAGTRNEIDSARDSKGRFYPLNYGNSDNCDFRFSIANCKRRTTDIGSQYWWEIKGNREDQELVRSIAKKWHPRVRITTLNRSMMDVTLPVEAVP